MDGQVHRDSHSSGAHESHGVHLCHKCGWPFPNPHPSARHRRAHKRVCGTIEGYKLVDSGETMHTAASDDEHLSDEDHKIPSPQVMDGSVGKSIAGTGALSNRSEDEVFSDANAEFPDCGFSPGSEAFRQENASKQPMILDKVDAKDLSANLSLKDCADADITQTPASASDRSQLKDSDIEASLSDLSASQPESQDDRNDSACKLNPVSVEASPDVLQSKDIRANDSMPECSETFVREETDAEGRKEISSGRSQLGDIISHREQPGDTSEKASKSEKGVDVTSDIVPTGGIVQLKESPLEVLDSSISIDGNSGEKTDARCNLGLNLERNSMDVEVSQQEHANTMSDTVSKGERREEITSNNELADGIIQLKGEHSTLLPSEVAGSDLPPNAKSAEHINAAVDAAQTKVDATQVPDLLNSNDEFNEMGERSETVYVLSVPDDIPVVENAAITLEDFKDHKNVKLNQSAELASGELTKNNEEEIKGLGSKENSNALHSRQSSENNMVPASEMCGLEDSIKHEGRNSKPMIQEVVVKEEADVLQIDGRSGKLGGLAHEDTTEIEGDDKACSLAELHPHHTSDDLQPKDFSGIAKEVSSDVNPVDFEVDQIANTDDASNHEKGETGVRHISRNNNDKKAGEEHVTESTISSFESANNLSKSQVNPASNLLEADNASGHENGKSENITKDGVESEEGLVEENILKTSTLSEGASTHIKCQRTEDVNDECLGKSEETLVDHVTKPLEDIKGREKRNNDKVPGDFASEVSMATEKPPEDVKEKEKRNSDKVPGDFASEVSMTTEKPLVDVKEREKRNSYKVPGDFASEVSMATEKPPEDVKEKEIRNSDKVPGDFASEVSMATEKPLEDVKEREKRNSDKVTADFASEVSMATEKPLEDVKEKEKRNSDKVPGDFASEVSMATEKPEEDVKEREKRNSDKVPGDFASEVLMANDSDPGRNKFQKSSVDQVERELPSSSLDIESTVKCSAVENSDPRECGGDASGNSSVSLQGKAANDLVKHELDTTAVDLTVESSSQTDSLEGNWGSISVLSTQSDAPAVIDAEALQSTDLQMSVGVEKANLRKPDAFGDQHPDKSDVFEAPSFMTLVEPGSGDGVQQTSASKVETTQNPEQLKSSAMQAGWFPSLSHVPHESPGRKKNEEIIAKVTNWNVKQHTPLKNLLGEASAENKAKLPNSKENPSTVLQRDEKLAKDNGVSTMKVSSILGPEAPIDEPAKTVAGKEWNSPARYPADIKREKKKVKGRPYWVQFVCCSSLN